MGQIQPCARTHALPVVRQITLYSDCCPLCCHRYGSLALTNLSSDWIEFWWNVAEPNLHHFHLPLASAYSTCVNLSFFHSFCICPCHWDALQEHTRRGEVDGLRNVTPPPHTHTHTPAVAVCWGGLSNTYCDWWQSLVFERGGQSGMNTWTDMRTALRHTHAHTHLSSWFSGTDLFVTSSCSSPASLLLNKTRCRSCTVCVRARRTRFGSSDGLQRRMMGNSTSIGGIDAPLPN